MPLAYLPTRLCPYLDPDSTPFLFFPVLASLYKKYDVYC